MQLLGKLKPPKKNVSIVIRKLQGEVLEKFQNFSETTTDDAGNGDKKTPGSTRAWGISTMIEEQSVSPIGTLAGLNA